MTHNDRERRGATIFRSISRDRLWSSLGSGCKKGVFSDAWAWEQDHRGHAPTAHSAFSSHSSRLPSLMLMDTHRRSEDVKEIWHCGFVSCFPNTILKLILPLLVHPFIRPGNINWCAHSPPPLFIDPSILRSHTPNRFEVLQMIDSWPLFSTCVPCWCSGPIRPRELSPSLLLEHSYQLQAP